MGCSASSPIHDGVSPAAKAKDTTSETLTEQAPPTNSAGSPAGGSPGNVMDSLVTGTKLYMSLYPADSTDGSECKA
jgi:hypothetical protein